MSVKREAQSNNVIELSFIGCLIARRNSTCPSKRARATCWSTLSLVPNLQSRKLTLHSCRSAAPKLNPGLGALVAFN